MLEKLFGSKLRAKIIVWLFLHSDKRYFVRQLEGILNVDATNLSRELSKLEKLKILKSCVEGRQKYYQVDRDNPIYADLESIVRKTDGMVNVLKEALRPLFEKIDFAFVYGSMAEGSETHESDIDLLIIGSCSFRQVVSSIYDAQIKMGREINPTVYSRNEWIKKFKSKHHFINSIYKTKKIFIAGSEDDLGKIAKRK